MDAAELNRHVALIVLERGSIAWPGEMYDWECAFKEAGESVSAVVGQQVPAVPVQLDDVSTLIAADPGENDGPDWLCVAFLKDGRWAFLSAGCDYTGWDCQASGHIIVALDLPTLIQFGLGADDRARLRLEIDA